MRKHPTHLHFLRTRFPRRKLKAFGLKNQTWWLRDSSSYHDCQLDQSKQKTFKVFLCFSNQFISFAAFNPWIFPNIIDRKQPVPLLSVFQFLSQNLSSFISTLYRRARRSQTFFFNFFCYFYPIFYLINCFYCFEYWTFRIVEKDFKTFFGDSTDLYSLTVSPLPAQLVPLISVVLPIESHMKVEVLLGLERTNMHKSSQKC